MRRGTTPTYTIYIDDIAELEQQDIYVTIKQDNTAIVKHGADLTVDANSVQFALSQEETLSLHHGYADVQMRGIKNGFAWATDMAVLPIEPILQDAVIPLTI